MIQAKRIGVRIVFKKIAGLFTLLVLFVFSSCRNEGLEKKIRSLDSLNGALNQKISELKATDTLTLQKAITRFNDYNKFIHQNISDTVSKEEADRLQEFYKSGKNLLSFEENRKTVIARGNLISSQLNKLITDARNNTVSEDFELQLAKERSSAELLIKQSLDQQQVFLENLQEFKLSLGGVETLIRSRNNGQMPVVIRDSIPF